MAAFALNEIFTDAELKAAIKIIQEAGPDLLDQTVRIRRELIEPNMERINKITDQENDSSYWALLVVHVLSHELKS